MKLNPFNIFKTDVSEIESKIPDRIKGENTDYTKFIILAHPRSGSSFLVKLLKSHPQILTYGELFMKKRVNFMQEDFDPIDSTMLEYRNNQPTQFLENVIFKPLESNIKAVGFKVFPFQISAKKNNAVWKWLEKNQDTKIIFLHRANLLEAYCSYMVAEKDHQWHITSHEERKATKISLNAKKVARWIENTENRRNQAIERLTKHDRHTLTYEELATDPNAQTEAIQNFLGIDHTPLHTVSRKKEYRSMSEAIENFQELKSEFRNTKWSHFFD